jgi:hypothetical protein
MNRRTFLTGLVAAPFIVRAGLIMPVRAPIIKPTGWRLLGVKVSSGASSRFRVNGGPWHPFTGGSFTFDSAMEFEEGSEVELEMDPAWPSRNYQQHDTPPQPEPDQLLPILSV